LNAPPEEGEDAARSRPSDDRSPRPILDHAAGGRHERGRCKGMRCSPPAAGGPFWAPRRPSQVVGEALRPSLPHSALAPSGHPSGSTWRNAAPRAFQPPPDREEANHRARRPHHAAFRNAMAVTRPSALDAKPAAALRDRTSGRAVRGKRSRGLGWNWKGEPAGAAPGRCVLTARRAYDGARLSSPAAVPEVMLIGERGGDRRGRE